MSLTVGKKRLRKIIKEEIESYHTSKSKNIVEQVFDSPRIDAQVDSGGVAPGSVYGQTTARSQTPGGGREVDSRASQASSESDGGGLVTAATTFLGVLGFVDPTNLLPVTGGLSATEALAALIFAAAGDEESAAITLAAGPLIGGPIIASTNRLRRGAQALDQVGADGARIIDRAQQIASDPSFDAMDISQQASRLADNVSEQADDLAKTVEDAAQSARIPSPAASRADDLVDQMDDIIEAGLGRRATASFRAGREAIERLPGLVNSTDDLIRAIRAGDDVVDDVARDIGELGAEFSRLGKARAAVRGVDDVDARAAGEIFRNGQREIIENSRALAREIRSGLRGGTITNKNGAKKALVRLGRVRQQGLGRRFLDAIIGGTTLARALRGGAIVVVGGPALFNFFRDQFPEKLQSDAGVPPDIDDVDLDDLEVGGQSAVDDLQFGGEEAFEQIENLGDDEAVVVSTETGDVIPVEELSEDTENDLDMGALDLEF